MADTVEAANERLDTLINQLRRYGVMPDADEMQAAKDALIAAVRAEMQEAIDTKVRAHEMAIDRAFALAEEVERLNAQIAAVRTERDTPTRCRHCGRACQVDECLDCWRQRHAS